jgi:hypothetical protein
MAQPLTDSAGTHKERRAESLRVKSTSSRPIWTILAASLRVEACN